MTRAPAAAAAAAGGHSTRCCSDDVTVCQRLTVPDRYKRDNATLID